MIFNTWFSWLKRQGLLPIHEAHALEQVERIRYRKGEVKLWTAAEARAVLAHCGVEMWPVIAIAAFAGVRTYEISRLFGRHVRFDSGFLGVPLRSIRKTKKRRLVPWQRSGCMLNLSALGVGGDMLAAGAQMGIDPEDVVYKWFNCWSQRKSYRWQNFDAAMRRGEAIDDSAGRLGRPKA